ncbi:MAG: DinB family protein, partial [Ignavibacteria bacterium]|nr:DinB family protein [Ignavibacteria bacterium]
MNLNEPLLVELQIESGTTRKMLERVRQDSLAWKPHEKSRTLGELASHIANLPGLFIAPLNQEELDRNAYKSQGDTVAEFVDIFERNTSNS